LLYVPAPDVSGFFPVIPNWNVGLMIDLPFLDIIRIKAEKKVVTERITAAQHAYDLVIQGLRRDDVQARATVRAAVALASNMPVQVQAAELAAKQAQARYEAGLATVAQVAEANQILADSRVKEAVANVGVWRALLSVANVHGNLQPFLKAADNATRGEFK
jgi:outer membrane protein